jgi:hypothetical protein
MDQKQNSRGLRGRDKQQGELRDTVGRTEHYPRGAQHGAEVRSPKIVVEVDALPDGLKRERSGPLNPRSGRDQSEGGGLNEG